jgi:adenine-specific DNA-methyltransferase
VPGRPRKKTAKKTSRKTTRKPKQTGKTITSSRAGKKGSHKKTTRKKTPAKKTPARKASRKKRTSARRGTARKTTVGATGGSKQAQVADGAKAPSELEIVEVVTESPSLFQERTERLLDVFPEVNADGRIDLDKLRELLSEEVDSDTERYSLSWSGKADARRFAQVPSQGTLRLNETTSVEPPTTSNAFVNGDNLEVLKLLYKAYFGRIKMIYIDPPYNKGSDQIYKDNYANPLEVYLKLSGQSDEEGALLTSNPETSGRYHSDWLSMMYPRLAVARHLLSDDGVIFVSIDDREVHNLRLIMDEIFGPGAFVADLVVVNNLKGRSDRTHIATAHERLLMYA